MMRRWTRKVPIVNRDEVRSARSHVVEWRLSGVRVRWAASAFFCTLLGISAQAQAQATDRVLAEELFRQGQELMKQERYAEACPKLAESQRLDPGTGTLLNLAVCHEHEGKLATAWTEYSQVVTLARRDNRPDRVEYAEKRIAAIEPRLPRLTVTLSPGSDVPGLVVRLDDAELGRPALGVALPIDPGTHELTATAPGKQPFRTTIHIEPGLSRGSVTVPALLDAPAEAEAREAGAEAGANPSTSTLEPVPTTASPRGNAQRIVGLSMGGLGVVGIGIGAAFGFSAISKFNESNRAGCEGRVCDPDAAKIRNDARAAGNVSTIAFAAGAGLLGAGAILYFTAPKASVEDHGFAVTGLTVGPTSLGLRAVW